MTVMPREIVALLFSFLYLDDWFYYRQLSRAHAYVTNKFGKCVRSIVTTRFHHALKDRFEDRLQEFVTHLQRGGGVIAGSFWIQLLLGKEKFYAKDMDIFEPWGLELWRNHLKPEEMVGAFSPLQHFLFDCAKGPPYVRNDVHRTGDTVLPQLLHLLKPSDAEDIDFDHYTGLIDGPFCSIHGARIGQVWTYGTPLSHFSLVQVISVFSAQNKQLSAKEFIESCFDFRCCMGMYSIDRMTGEPKIQLPNLSDIHKRQLVFRDVFRRRMELVAPSKVTSYVDNRVQKYIQRGFALASDSRESDLGIYWRVLLQLPLELDRLYTLDELHDMCEQEHRAKLHNMREQEHQAKRHKTH